MAKKISSIIVSDMSSCIFCGRPREAVHHCFGGPNRANSEKYRLVIPLCNEHHNMSDYSVHFNETMRIKVQAMAQMAFENKYSHEKFMQVFWKNILEGEEL